MFCQMAGLVKNPPNNLSLGFLLFFFLQVTKTCMQRVSKTWRQEFVGSFVISPFLSASLSKGLGSEVTNSTVRSILA